LKLPREELTELYVSATAEPRRPTTWQRTLYQAATTPWEIARARRAARLLITAKLTLAATPLVARAGMPPYQGGWINLTTKNGVIPWYELTPILPSTPLLRLMFPNVDHLIQAADRNEVGR